MISTRCSVALLLTALAVGTAWAKKYDPFQVPKDEVRRTVKVVALRSPRPPQEVAHPEAIMAEYDSLLAAELSDAGFTVIPASVADSIVQQVSDSLGGLFDVKTGAMDESKKEVLAERLRRELRASHNADAILYCSFELRKAVFGSGTARWDGVSETVTKGVFGFFSGSQTQGTVGAMSLFVALQDLSGRDLYVNGGGIRVLSKLSTFSREAFKDQPIDSVFARPKRNANAVHVALERLTEQDKKK
jgi:hypothetical protein